jgi:hypothetical protein
LIHELKGMSACKAPHLLKALNRHQGSQRLALPFDDELVVPEGDPVQHVSNSLPNIHRRNFVGQLTTPSSIIVALDAICNDNRNNGGQRFSSPEREGGRRWGLEIRRG